MSLSHIPTDEMVKDRADAIEDAANCRRALAFGHRTYSGGSVVDRLRSNIRQIQVISAELARRLDCPVHGTEA